MIDKRIYAMSPAGTIKIVHPSPLQAIQKHLTKLTEFGVTDLFYNTPGYQSAIVKIAKWVSLWIMRHPNSHTDTNRAALFLFGEQETGKSTVAEALQDLLGGISWNLDQGKAF